MPISDTRLAIRLDDKASAGLNSLSATYNRFANTITNSGRQMGGFASNADKAAGSLSNMSKTMERLVYSASRYFVIYKALGAVGNVWDTMVGGAYEYAKSLETNQIGIAGILKSMVTLNGEQIKWNDAMALSGKAMKGLQSEALRTAATSKELIETFRALLGPGLSSGMSIDQIVQLSTVGTNAVRSLGLPSNQYVQELRSIITEGIRPASSTLATSLGITNKDIKEAKASSEGLFNFLMKRMQGFSDAVKYTSGTVEGRIARIQEGLQVAGAKGAQALYQSFSSVLEDIANYLIPIPKKLGDQWEINPAFIKGIQDVSETVGKVVESIGGIGKTIAPLIGGMGGAGLTAIGQLADKLPYIAAFFGTRKLAPYVADVAQIAVHSREAYESQTWLGKAIQGISDKVSGRTAALRSMIEQEQRAAEVERMYGAELAKVNAAISQIRIAEQNRAQQQKMGAQMSQWFGSATDSFRAENITTLIQKLRELGTEEARIEALTRRYYQFVKTASLEDAEAIRALIETEEKEIQTKKRQNEEHAKWGETVRNSAERAGTLLSTIGGLSMSFGILCDVLGQADEENKEWYESAGNAAMTGGMFATAIGSITSAVAGMIPMIHRGIEALQKFAQARTLAGIGLAGGVAAGIGAIVYNAYRKFQETGVASQLDEYGNEVSHDFNGMRDIDDADSYAILNNPSYDYAPSATTGTIGVQDFGNKVGGGSKGGGGGGSAKANKAEEYAARIKKHVEDLNKEITNMNSKATAYDKTMAQAKEKIAGYEKDIVKAQQLGVDVGEIRQKQLEYSLAMEKKATEAQQDEYLKYMKMDEEAAGRIHIMGGTMEQQRAVLEERLENHKAYLEELLSAEIENKERRAQLEQELANVQKQINDNSIYEFKNGWAQALDELANRQINFKDSFVSAFDSIEGSLVTLVSSTGSAKDKFKQFCEDVTNTILKSMTQIIIRGLITKAIMGAIGLGGGSISVGDTSGMSGWLGSFSGGSLVGSGGISVGLAGGGKAQAGGTYVVGENGPELLSLGSQSGRIYNDRQTKAMLGGGIENVKVEVINKSGQEVKSNEANVRFDGKTMIISTVIEAVSTNYMGMRSMLKGVATT